ncbi:MAG: hypothetical protein RI560_04405 [Natronomonas sp.]|uniref:hypothetical protein n=1 Tax=Natronomonas sp. TaxID=2184060 RepID=UPI00287077EA|nr:hypothetical protein [Natronomonas sp.]MDR9380898.1 hypothetical protein [Natronomonas sp.]MDR9431872.1 hypothetical protein [Natronomonas sp.]
MNLDLSVRDPRKGVGDPLDDGVSDPAIGGPGAELAAAEMRFRAAEFDEEATMWDPGTHPKAPHLKEEATTDRAGTRAVDVQRDTPRVDDLADFDLSAEDLSACDL